MLERRKSNMAKDNFITHKREYMRAYKDAWVAWCCVWCGVEQNRGCLPLFIKEACLGLDGFIQVVQVA